jgi:hypothetical protein
MQLIEMSVRIPRDARVARPRDERTRTLLNRLLLSGLKIKAFSCDRPDFWFQKVAKNATINI